LSFYLHVVKDWRDLFPEAIVVCVVELLGQHLRPFDGRYSFQFLLIGDEFTFRQFYFTYDRPGKMLSGGSLGSKAPAQVGWLHVVLCHVELGGGLKVQVQ
jgi:hypothetical protein